MKKPNIFGFKNRLLCYYLSRVFRISYFVNSSLRKDFNDKLRKAIGMLNLNGLGEANLIIIGGRRIDRKNIKRLNKSNFKITYWYTDSSNRFKGVEAQSALYDKILYHDGGDFENSLHLKKQWMPYGFNDNLYAPSSAEKKDIDILFTGYLKQPEYKTRLEYLHTLMNSCLPEKYKVVAVVTTYNKTLIKQLEQAKVKHVGRIQEIEYASYIKRAKVVINIIQDDGERPINPLFFAIPFAKSIQITNKLTHLNGWLSKGVHYIEAEKDDLVQTLLNLLENNNSGLNIGEAHTVASSNSLSAVLMNLLKE